MTTTITGLGSGFDIDSWVSALVSAKEASTVTPLEDKLSVLETKSSALSDLQTKCSTLLSALQAFTKIIYNSSSDMWTNTTITSSNSSYATATSTGNVAAASVTLEIEQIATATTASSNTTLGVVSADDLSSVKFTNLANGQAEAGDFSIFLNGKEYTVTIDSDDTVQDVIDKISDTTGGLVQASVSDDGYFSIYAYTQDEDGEWVVDETAELSIGSSADTSNFASALKLYEQVGTYGYEGSYALSTVLTDVAMTDEESGLTGLTFFDENGEETDSGTITINGIEFTITSSTTLDSLISAINGNSDTNVQASYDSLTNRLILTSTETGANNISLSEDGTNLLTVLGLMETDENGDEILASGSQTLGQNAIVYINGNRVVSTSNTITGESSGISNLSITVKKVTSAYSEDSEDDASVTLDIEPDYTEVEEALQTFVDAYNDVISTIKSATTSDGTIGSDSTLQSLASTLKSILSGSNENDGMYTLLSQIGISTSSSDISNISIDTDTLEEALSENLYSVKMLLSDGYTSKTDSGIFDQLASVLSTILDSTSGYFTTYSSSIDSQISSLESRITAAQSRLATYEELITEKFNNMDSALSSLSAQLATFQAYFS